MARRRKHGGGGHEGGGGSERWLLTYADMITLLLALFIVLFAMSSIDATRFDSLKRTLAQSFRGNVLDSPGRVLDGSKSLLDSTQDTPRSPTPESMLQESNAQTSGSMQREQRHLKHELAKLGATGSVKVQPSERGTIISLAGDAFFASGSDQLRPQAERVLASIAADLKAEGRQLSIEGHTDGQPLHGGPFHNNWLLSGARATTVLLFLNSHGVPQDHMQIRGYADTHPKVHPPYPGAAIPANRRVEIVVLGPDTRGGVTTSAAGDEIAVSGAPSGSPATPRSRIVDPIVIISEGTP